MGTPCGDMYTHNNYVCTWNNRRVTLSYSKKNGCGSITFGFTPEEQTEQAKRAKSESLQQKIDHAKFLHDKRPQKFCMRLAEIYTTMSEIRRDFEYGFYTAEEMNDIIAPFAEKRAIYESVM